MDPNHQVKIQYWRKPLHRNHELHLRLVGSTLGHEVEAVDHPANLTMFSPFVSSTEAHCHLNWSNSKLKSVGVCLSGWWLEQNVNRCHVDFFCPWKATAICLSTTKYSLLDTDVIQANNTAILCNLRTVLKHQICSQEVTRLGSPHCSPEPHFLCTQSFALLGMICKMIVILPVLLLWPPHACAQFAVQKYYSKAFCFPWCGPTRFAFVSHIYLALHFMQLRSLALLNIPHSCLPRMEKAQFLQWPAHKLILVPHAKLPANLCFMFTSDNIDFWFSAEYSANTQQVCLLPLLKMVSTQSSGSHEYQA